MSLSNLTKLFSNFSLKSTFQTSVRFMSQGLDNKSPFWPGYDALLMHHLKGKHVRRRPNINPLPTKPYTKGVVLRTLVRKPKKPNSANRKCVLVKLSDGREMQAYVPGEGHNLQEHSVVLVKWYPCKDVSGVKLRCVRGARDLPHVVKK